MMFSATTVTTAATAGIRADENIVGKAFFIWFNFSDPVASVRLAEGEFREIKRYQPVRPCCSGVSSLR